MSKRIAILLLVGMLTGMPSTAVLADETALFTTVAPDILFLLDASGSMLQTPAGETLIVYSTDPACMGGWWMSGYRTSFPITDCRKFAIAKRAIFSVMDDNRDGVITQADEASLNIRIGYGVFLGGEGPYYRIQKEIGSHYTNLFCNLDTSCDSADVGYQNNCFYTNPPYFNGPTRASDCIFCEKSNGGTPLNAILDTAKTYLDQNKAADSSQSCRQKFVIILTDGADTYDCNGSGDENKKAYQRRRNSVLRVKALRDAGYKVFVVGFGSDMPDLYKNTLNWMAYYGGTDNPMVTNSGDTTALDLSAFSPSACTSGTATEATTGADCDNDPPWGSGPNCFAVSNDPATLPLAGYAFLTRNSEELQAALKQAVAQIREANYSFATASVASARLQDENYIYEASFTPINADSLWLGYLKKYNINNDGTVGSVAWDAGTKLQSTAETSRNIYTMKAGTWKAFTTGNILPSDLGLATSDTAGRNLVVGFIRGSSTYNIDNWKLGDIFRSAPVTVGTPAVGYADTRDSANAFDSYRSTNLRSSVNGRRIILAGANDGQLHAFRTSDGLEMWSFIPPNLLPKLKSIAHNTHPTGLSHAYLVDGPISVADVWRGTGDGKTKAASDWKTLAIFGLGRGAGDNLWSSSENCDANFSNMYSTLYDGGGNVIATADKYCGYHALDITDTGSPPIYKFTIKPTAAQAPYLGDPWSRIYAGRVLSGGNEKWVGFMGAGHNMSHCPGGEDCDTRGKGFFLIGLFDDASTGNGKIFWGKTRADVNGMNYALPAPAALVDTDGDGFVDMAYIGDLGGNVWRFKFCTRAMGDGCTTANWSVSLLFDAAGNSGRPIYSVPAVARDAYNNVWVYWGTGDKVNPTTRTTQETFFAVKDADLTSTKKIGDLENITNSAYTDNATKKGWYINLPTGEKVLAEATVFGGVVYFTSYTPAAAHADACSQAGEANLYGVDYVTGAGTLAGSARTTTLGVGIPTAPTISLSPDGTRPDLYVTLSGGAGTSASTVRAPVSPPYVSNRTNILLWRDNRVQ